MGMYKRENGIYYLNKTINKRTYRLSLETKNYHEAKERYEMFCTKLFYNKIQYNIKEIPLIMRESTFKSSKAHHRSIQTKSINQAYKDYLKIAKHNGITEGKQLRLKKSV